MIKILCVGKIKENYLKEMIEDYKKRISKYHKIEVIEVRDEDNLENEKNHLMPFLSPRDYVITLEILGTLMTSEEFAKKIDETFLTHSNITFVIGSSLGLHDEIKQRADIAIDRKSVV